MTREKATEMAKRVAVAMGEPRHVVVKENGEHAICSAELHDAAVAAGAKLRIIETVEPATADAL